jgi:hypothetical protein
MIRDYQLDAFLEESGQRVPFHLRISAPEKTQDEDDYFCRVHAPTLFADDKEIFGIDEEQARELALQFVRSMLAGKKLVDQNGREVVLAKP